MKISYLACDGGCPARYELPEKTKSVPGVILRRSAWKAGWFTDSAGRDYCPVCYRKFEAKQAVLLKN